MPAPHALEDTVLLLRYLDEHPEALTHSSSAVDSEGVRHVNLTIEYPLITDPILIHVTVERG